jgi:hypothetical protein
MILIRKPHCLKAKFSACYFVITFLDSICTMNFLVAAFIQLRLGAPRELMDPQNFIAFPIVVFYWVILPIYRINCIRAAR